MKITAFLCLLSLLLLNGCGPTTVSSLERQAGARPLDAARVLELVENNTLLMEDFESKSYLYFHDSGRVFGVDIYNNKDRGRWDVSDQGELCFRFQNWWYGDLLCYQVLGGGHGEGYQLAGSSGVIKFRAVWFEGDYKNAFYAVKEPRKSYRRSVRRARKQQAAAPSPGPSAASVESSPAPSGKAGGKSIVEENSYHSPTVNRQIRSTVKWMARDCPGCNLAHTDLKKADLVAARLAGANLAGANLRMANLRRADLQGANLEDAILTYANLPGADLRNANLKGADLKGANLIRADLTGADLTGADLSDALLEGTKGLPDDRR